jgi:hypothetical protein
MMTEQELKEKLGELRQELGFAGSNIWSKIKWVDGQPVRKPKKLGEKQVAVAEKFLKLLEAMNWQLALNSYKHIKTEAGPALQTNNVSMRGYECGQLVKVRSTRPEHGKKTYLGFLIGDVATSINVSIQGDTLNVGYGLTNPAIFVPELRTVIYGYESWWGAVKTPEQLAEITDETIQQQWYVQLLQNMPVEGGEDDTE